jgi:hypothetical protein
MTLKPSTFMKPNTATDIDFAVTLLNNDDQNDISAHTG